MKSRALLTLISIALIAPLALAFTYGEAAPNFTLQDTDGNLHELEAYRGSIVFLQFMGFSCQTCYLHAPMIESYIHEHYSGEPVVVLALDHYNGTDWQCEMFRDQCGISYPILLDALNYATQNNAIYRHIILDADGIVRLISPEQEIDIAACQDTIDHYLSSLDDPTFTFEMHDTTLTLSNPDSAYVFHGRVDNLLDAERSLVYTVIPVDFPNENRMIAVCTHETCYPPAYGDEYTLSQLYYPMQQDSLVSFYLYNMIPDSEGFPVLDPIDGTYVMDVSVHNPDEPTEVLGFRLHLIDSGTDVDIHVEPLPVNHALLSNYPNPFNPDTRISFTITQAGPVTLSIHDLLGRTVAELINNPLMQAGSYSASWNATNSSGEALPAGSYFARLISADQTVVHRIVLVK